MKLSCFVQGTSAKFAIQRDGKTVVAQARTFENQTPKERILSILEIGLLQTRKYTKAGEVFVIELQNSTVASWLQDKLPEEDYIERLAAIRESLEKLNVQLRILTVKTPIAKNAKVEQTTSYSGVETLFSGMVEEK